MFNFYKKKVSITFKGNLNTSLFYFENQRTQLAGISKVPANYSEN